MKTPYDKLVKIYSKYFDHMAKMTATPIYSKNHFNFFFSRTRKSVILGLGMYHWGYGTYQVCSNDDSLVDLDLLNVKVKNAS